ncbi:MAG: Hsp33 family molecular chaperone HslO [Aquabacterium sp.]|nr:Hsp33 family molecular chaperone HslO [Aquabacterium sp.]
MDRLHKFLFEGMPVRGMIVRLEGGWRDLLARRTSRDDGGHAFTQPVRSLLGEMAAAACLMQANLKFNGALVLQVFGDGPVKLAVAEAQHDLSFRATAKVSGPVPAGAGLKAMLNVHGKGRCAITLDPKDRLPGQQPYQGVVPLHGDRREPLDEDAIGRSEDYNRIAMLAGTLTAEELLALDPDDLMRRLFWQERVLRFEPQTPHFACTCSRERVARMLFGLGREEVQGIVDEQGQVEIGCDFCGAQYRFDPVDALALFTPDAERAPGSPSVQ